jgi:uncharacterized protein
MRNPFRYGSVVSGGQFCGRERLIDQLIGSIEAGQNVLLQGERRIGKTSLACETIRRMKKMRILPVNLMEVKSIDELCKRILHALLSLEHGGSRFDRLLKSLAYLRPVLTLNPVTGEPSVSFDAMAHLQADSIPEVLALIQKHHNEKPLVAFLDEFQDVLNLEEPRAVLAQLRGTIQHQADLPYLFAGSIRNRMDEIFNHPESPFFKSALTLSVEPLAPDEFGAFLAEKFATGDRRVRKEALDRVFALTEGITGDVQQFCEALWMVTEPGEEITEETLPRALNLVFTREQKSYELSLARLTAGYVRILNTLARLGGEQPNSSAFVRAAGASNASAVVPSLKRMADQKIVFQDGKRWRFTNPFFRAWLLAADSLSRP